MRTRGARMVATVSLAAALGVVALSVHAQQQTEVGADFGAELDAEVAYSEAQNGHNIRAREIAERIVERNPDDYAGNFVLGYVFHYGEANFPRALFYENRALAELTRLHGSAPESFEVRRWHFRMLRELAWTHGDLEQYDQQLEYMNRFTELYEPAFVAERAWPLMKLRRFDDARVAAELGRQTGDPRQVEVALNALCAIEFEAGDEARSYSSCREAMDLHGADPTTQGAVDFTNFAEAARSVFRLDEAERVGRLATEAQMSWYGNPWSELAELYVREGRYAEALNALREVAPYRERRPPHVRDADRSETRRALASFFLLIGRPDESINYAEKALHAPDRRAHTSRDPLQDRAIAALLHRAALRLRAEQRGEQA
ncbi:MAG: tetratricopeptide repeat protein, partial [Myxococcales bacterium]|nr:tetratricopeptide repeat protein [Myxococcales bacterium]